jgi:hypothetical protein
MCRGCSIAARDELALGGGGVILSACLPCVVGELVVVPNADPGHGGVQGLQVGVGAVLGVALAVVSQNQQFIGRLHFALEGCCVLRGIAAPFILVDVVAQVQSRVHPWQLGCFGIGIEVARRVIGA